MASAPRSASAAPRLPWPGVRRAMHAWRRVRRSTSACGSRTSVPAARSPTCRRRGPWTTPCAGWPGAPISCCSTARSGRTTSSRPRASTGRRRGRWGTFRSVGRVAAWRCCRGSTRSGWPWFTSTTRIRSCVAAPRSGRRSRRPALWWRRTRWSSSCERAGRPAARRAGAPLSPPPPLQPADAPGRAVARRAATVGGEPLLLSDQHSHQGRLDPLELPRARGAPAVDPADYRPRRPAGGGGRHRGVATFGRSDGRETRGSGGPAVSAARRALRRGCVCELLPVPALARGGGRLAHRDVRAPHSERAAVRDAEPLPMGGSRGAAVFQEPAHTGAARCGIRPRARHRAVADAGATGSRRRGAPVQVRCAVVSARFGGARPPPGDGGVMALGPTVPRLHPKARLQRDDVRGRDVLLYPEGLVALNPTGAEILALCDGVRSVADVVAALEQRYGSAALERDVTAFLDGRAAKGLVTYGS